MSTTGMVVLSWIVFTVITFAIWVVSGDSNPILGDLMAGPIMGAVLGGFRLVDGKWL